MSSYFEPDPITPTQATNINNAATVARSGTTQVAIVLPDLANFASVGIPAGPWVYSGWATIAAANALALHELIGLLIEFDSTTQFQFQIGTGAAGVEVAVFAGGGYNPGGGGGGAAFWVPVVPAVQIPANARVSFRAAAAAAGNSNCKATFLPRPA